MSFGHPTLLCVAVLSSLALLGCESTRTLGDATAAHANAGVATSAINGQSSLATQGGVDVRGGQVDVDRRAAEQLAHVVLRRSSKAWISGTSVPTGSGQQLPSVFSEPVKLNFDDRPTLRTMAERLTALSGVPIRIKADAGGDTSGGARIVPAIAGNAAATPITFRDPMTTVPMKWSGSLEGYLNHVTNLTGLSWEYRDGVVVIERLRTEFFEVAATDGESSFSVGMAGNDTGTGGAGSSGGGSAGSTNASSATSDVADKGKSNPVESILLTLKQLVQDVPGSQVVRADGSGRIAVTTTKETMTKVADFMRTENDALRRQVQVQFDIYSVRHNQNDQRGVDWEALAQSVSHAWGAAISSPVTLTTASVGTVGLSILNSGTAGAGNSTARRFGNSKAILDLLSEYGNSSEHHAFTVTSKNRQWGRQANLSSQAYVSMTTPGLATAVGAGAPGLTTSTVTTGDRFLAKAQLLNNGSVSLQYAISLSSLIGLPTFTSGNGTSQQSVQVPNTTSVVDQESVSLKAGEVLVITGMSRTVASDNRRTLTEQTPIALGGSGVATTQREDILVLVRATSL